MARSRALNERLRAESRAKIMEHALRLFGEHGYEGTSMQMIASAARISPGLIYNYFTGKDALLEAIFRTSMEDVRASFAEADAAAGAEERLERLLRASFEILDRNRDFWKLSYGVRMQPAVVARLGDALPRWTNEIRRTLERYLRDAGVPEPELEALILFALIDGVSQHYVLDSDRYPLGAVAARIAARYRLGAGPKRMAIARERRRSSKRPP